MSTASLAFSTPADKPRWQRWLIFSPLARIVIFVALTWAATKGLVLVLHAFGLTMKGASPVTAAGLVRPGFRNWFRPRSPYVYATFRCARTA